MADAARATGYPVVEVAEWRTRGSETFDPKGLVWHHTAGASKGDMPSLTTIIKGRPDLPGPLSQFALGRSGTIYVVASGRANHAGPGGWKGLRGNASVVGIEAEHTGKAGVPWPEPQLDAYRKLSAQVLLRLGVSAELMAGHKEWAPTRKVDPRGLNMNEERQRVAVLMEEAALRFKDVPEKHTHFKGIEWAAENDLMGEVRDGKFEPNTPLTRAQFATVLKRFHDRFIK